MGFVDIIVMDAASSLLWGESCSWWWGILPPAVESGTLLSGATLFCISAANFSLSLFSSPLTHIPPPTAPVLIDSMDTIGRSVFALSHHIPSQLRTLNDLDVHGDVDQQDILCNNLKMHGVIMALVCPHSSYLTCTDSHGLQVPSLCWGQFQTQRYIWSLPGQIAELAQASLIISCSTSCIMYLSHCSCPQINKILNFACHVIE